MLGNLILDIKKSTEDYFPDESAIPEKKLLYAMLHRAIRDLYENGEKIRQRSLDWLFSEANRPFSAIWICDNLEIDHAHLIDRIKKNLIDIHRITF